MSTYLTEDDYIALKRQEYLAAVEEQRKRHELEEAIAIENARHRAQLEALAAEQEQQRRRFAGRRSSMYGPQHAVHHPSNAIPDCAGACGSKRASLPPQISQREQDNLEFIFGPHLERKPAMRSKPVEKRPEPQPRNESVPEEAFEAFIRQIFNVAETKAAEPKVAERQKTAPAAPAQAPKAAAPRQSSEASTSDSAHWSDAPKRAGALATISNIARQFETIRRTFVFPKDAKLDRLASSDEPRLAFTPTNAPIHAYEHALSELLTKLDAVESHGFMGVREARKELVVRVEKELDELEQKVAQVMASVASPAKVPVTVPEVVLIPVTSESDVEAVEEKEVHDVVMEVEGESTVHGYDLSEPIEAVQVENVRKEAPTVPAAQEEPVTIEVDTEDVTANASVDTSAPLVDLSESILFDPSPAPTVENESSRPVATQTEDIELPHVDESKSVSAAPVTTPITIDEPAQLDTSTVSDGESSDTETEDELDAVRVSVTLDGKVQIESHSDTESSPSDREFEML